MFAFSLLAPVFLGLFLGVLAQDYGCSASKRCTSGCCGPLDPANGQGYCGLGPEFCGAGNCTSTCNAKSECDPGWGPKWSAQEKCPLNVCCSKYGFCGTTEEFCGNKKVKEPDCKGSPSNRRTIGYYEGWSLSRTCDTMEPEDIPTGAYTHINFAFASIDPKFYGVVFKGSNQADLYKRVTKLKEFQPGLQYPVAKERSGNPADFKNYVTFLQNLRKTLGASGHKYGLSITIPSSYWYLRHFDVVNLAKTVDWFNLMSYDLHGTWDSTDRFIGSVVNAHTNLTEIVQSLDLLWRNNIVPSQVVMGLGFYGRSFTLADPKCSKAGCPFTTGGKAGPCTNSTGTLSYDEISAVVAAGAKVTFDKTAVVKQAVWDKDQWVSYDDKDTFTLKVDYANKRCLGGTMVWALSQDTQGGATNALNSKTGRKAKSLQKKNTGGNDSQACFITECSGTPGCPSGFGAVQQINGKAQNVNIGHGCSKGQKRTYCCPNYDMPKCQWRGGAPTCGIHGHCKEGEMELTYDTGGCSSGHKVLCCTSTKSDEPRSHCVWKGTASLCSRDNTCPADHPKEIARSNTGDNQKPCDFDSISNNLKRFCCTDPSPYTGCDWYTNGDIADHKYRKCSGRCPANKQLVATDSYCFLGGTRALCCDPPATANDGPISRFRDELQNIHDNGPCSDKDRFPYKRSVSTNRLESRGLSSDLFAAVSTLLNSRHEESYLQVQNMETFEEVYADFHMNTSSLNTFVENMNMEQPIEGRVVEALCEGDRAAATLACNLEAQNDLCQIPGLTNHSPLRSLLKRASDWLFGASPQPAWLTKRRFNFANDNDGPNPDPRSRRVNTGRIMQAVIDDQIPLLYQAQLAYRSNPAEGPFTDVEMEVVYDIRGHTDLSERPDDIFAVFHFHTLGMVESNGHRYPAIYDMNVYHGQTVFQNQMIRQPTGDWVVYYMRRSGGRNDRTGIFNCNLPGGMADPNLRTRALIAGHPSTQPVPGVDYGICTTRLREFTNALWRRGILNGAAYSWWNGVGWTHTEGNSRNLGPNGGPAPHPDMSTFPHFQGNVPRPYPLPNNPSSSATSQTAGPQTTT